ncbi:RNA-binding protein 48 isoform X1 [Cimex lectularius]|uniref:RNA-binding protein 48 n=1 Tax=Cimex lectularius TaxID=79782 RepID=A0A8I6SIV1_CIMLE|nr:RNA-binding protein 48 isoform X1 [Cimex lectularius]
MEPKSKKFKRNRPPVKADLSNEAALNLPHHVKNDLCRTRAPYRQGRKLTAVKVYTVNNESQHLLIFNVPSINLVVEIKALCERFGSIHGLYKLLTQNDEEFTETFHVHFSDIRQARFAKKQLDDRPFYGGVLHVCYAPEMESLEETRYKLINRRKEIAYYSGRTINSAPFMKTKFIPNKPQSRNRSNVNNFASLIKQSFVPENTNIPTTSQQKHTFPTFDYPSQKVWKQPGNVPDFKQNSNGHFKKFIPSSVIKSKCVRK